MSPVLESMLAHALPIGVRLAGLMTFAPFFGSEAAQGLPWVDHQGLTYGRPISF